MDVTVNLAVTTEYDAVGASLDSYLPWLWQMIDKDYERESIQ